MTKTEQINALRKELRWVLKEYRNVGVPEEMEGRYSKAQALLRATVQKAKEKPEKKCRDLTPLEIRVGRSSIYPIMTPQEQWDEDKRIGILDWDGSEEWLDRHGF